MDTGCVLTSSEIDFYVETMKPQNIQDLGNDRWLEWHERCQKLNQQATIEAISMRDEQVKEAIISFGKSHVLVQEAIVVNVWKNKILPYLWSLSPNPTSTVVAYTILYHEAIVASLLELIMFHEAGSASLGDFAADLLDYSYDYVSELLISDGSDTEDTSECPKSVLMKQQKELSFAIGIKCVSIIRYLSEHLDKMSLALVAKLYETYDIPILFVHLLMAKPWKKDGQIYNKGKWVKVKDGTLSLTEAQIWLTLRFLLLDKNCKTYYLINDGRKQQLMKLLPLLTPVILDQMSPLVELNHWLCQLSFLNANANQTRPILIEVLLELKSKILKEIKGKCKNIAKKQLAFVFIFDEASMMKIAQKLSAAYNTNVLEAFEESSNAECANCGMRAINRCSKCKKEWYCSRECQVEQWKVHKDKCIPQDN